MNIKTIQTLALQSLIIALTMVCTQFTLAVSNDTQILEVHTTYADTSGVCTNGVDTLRILGDYFDKKSDANLPLSDQVKVTLGEQNELTICSATDNEILAECPAGSCDPGDYLLTLMFGDTFKYSTNYDLTLGAIGQQGADGSQGPQGDVGPAGAVGSQGPQGDVGPAGADGSQGPQGDVGPPGADGSQGPQGVAGPAGAVGSQGPQGDVGPAGAVGSQGPQGVAGPAGADGIAAEAGDGLVLAGTTLSIASEGVTSSMLANFAVTDVKVTSVSASKVTSGTFNAANYDANGIWRMSTCPSGYSFTGGTNGNLCWSLWRAPQTYQNAQRDCYDEGAHMCTYSEFYHGWAAGTNPAFTNGDFIGDRVGDGLVMCVNNTTDITDFEGTCNKNENHWYRCCMGRGR